MFSICLCSRTGELHLMFEGLQPIGFDTYQARVSQTGDRSLWLLIWTVCLWCRVQTSAAQGAGGGRGVGLHLRTGTVSADQAEGSRCESTSHVSSFTPTNSPVLSALPSPRAPSTGLSILKSPSMICCFLNYHNLSLAFALFQGQTHHTGSTPSISPPQAFSGTFPE